MRADREAFRKLVGADRANVLATYAAIVENVKPVPDSVPTTPFDRVRVAFLDTSLDYSKDDELGALAAAHDATGGGPVIVKWVSALDMRDEILDPPDDMVEADFAELLRIARLDEPGAALFAALDQMTAAGLACSSAEEWCIFATDGRWMASSWNSADVYTLGGSDEFMDAYVTARPNAPDDAATWTDSIGCMFTEWVPVRRRRRPRVPGFLRKFLDKTDYEDRFAGSFTEGFLSRLYGREVAAELWQIHLDMTRLANPLIGDAWRELRILKAQRPELEARLREIWDGVSPPAA